MLRRGFILLIIFLVVNVGLHVGDALRLFNRQAVPHFIEVTSEVRASEKKTGKKTPETIKKARDKREPSAQDTNLDKLTMREERLRQEEARLAALKKEIEAKIQQLRALEARVSKLLKKRDEREEKRLVQLARVFESTPPEQAGPLLSKLDVKTAAAILYRMNGRKAGKIWGFVDADRAVKISEELTKLKEK